MLSAAPTVRAAGAPPRYDHVVVVVEENQSYSQMLGPSTLPPTAFPFFMWPDVLRMPLAFTQDTYIRSLARRSAVFTNSHGIAHPSQPNYLSLFSGSTQGVTSDATPSHSFNAPNLGGELIAAGDTFTGYSEDLPRAGYAGNDVGDYVRHHNPWVNFPDVPPGDNLSFSRFPGKFTKLPTVSFVIPNLQNDMHSGTIQEGDLWLESHLSHYARWARKHNSLLIVTWDEDNGTSANHIATLFSGAHIRPGQYSEPVNHDRVLRTLEDAYGLPATGNAAAQTPITDVFR